MGFGPKCLLAEDAAPTVVVRGEAAVGLMTAETIGKFILLRGAREAGGSHRAAHAR